MEHVPSVSNQPFSGLPVEDASKDTAPNNMSQLFSDLDDCEVSDVDVEQYSTSSDGGSIVRELNDMLEDSAADWQEYQNKKRGRQNSSHSPIRDGQKRGRLESATFVYIKGCNFDIAKEASKQPIKFKKALIHAELLCSR